MTNFSIKKALLVYIIVCTLFYSVLVTVIGQSDLHYITNINLEINRYLYINRQ